MDCGLALTLSQKGYKDLPCHKFLWKCSVLKLQGIFLALWRGLSRMIQPMFINGQDSESPTFLKFFTWESLESSERKDWFFYLTDGIDPVSGFGCSRWFKARLLAQRVNDLASKSRATHAWKTLTFTYWVLPDDPRDFFAQIPEQHRIPSMLDYAISVILRDFLLRSF